MVNHQHQPSNQSTHQPTHQATSNRLALVLVVRKRHVAARNESHLADTNNNGYS